MLKVTYPHDEAEHEHLGAAAWHGNGAVQLLRADPRRWALLLERLHADEDLTPLWDVEACEIVAGLYQRLHVPALPQLRRSRRTSTGGRRGWRRCPADAPVPRRLVEQAVSLGRDFVADDADRRADDPRRPALRERAGRGSRALAGRSTRSRWPATRTTSRRRCCGTGGTRWSRPATCATPSAAGSSPLVDAAGLDEQRARAWVVVREMHNALWTIEDAIADGRALDAEDRA